jgi:hypothetical protein
MPSEIIYSVFVSSTYEDLREERAAVQKALLQLHCMPISMELFGSADEETWEFIKRRIEDSDYYVVIMADKYGSTAEDGVSYTEKEYDYAKAINKPVLAFVHGDRNSIRREKTEDDVEKRSRLEAFIQKVRRSPVSFFTSPHDLATQVIVSFVSLRDSRPAVGFIRADRVPDLKRHAELLEENSHLRDELAKLRRPPVVPFDNASDIITLKAEVGKPQKKFVPEQVIERRLSLGEVFGLVAQLILAGRHEETALSISFDRLVYGEHSGYVLRRSQGSLVSSQILYLLFSKGLIDVEHTLVERDEEVPDFSKLMSGPLMSTNLMGATKTKRVSTQRTFWKLTDYGKKQFGLFVTILDTNPPASERNGLPAVETGRRGQSRRRRRKQP